MSVTRRLGFLVGALAVTGSGLAAAPGLAAEEVNLYTTREPQLIIPLLESFTDATGTQVNTVFVKDRLIDRITSERAQSPADVLITVDSGRLADSVEPAAPQASAPG